jgi:regulator of PEP synthase PpsR (kinase-PPPase family)
MPKKKEILTSIPIFVVSGGKGIAGHTMVHSLIIQYPDNKLPVNVIPDIQTEDKIIDVVQKVKKANGILTHTMVNSELRQILIRTCKDQGVRQIDFMGPLAEFLENELGLKSVNVPGLYRRINAQYFDRVEAIEYTLNHDDGLNPGRLSNAEIVLVGVSRSGKTPLSVYMSMFGWKVANVPLVKGIEPPEELFRLDPSRVFGLNISLSNLIAQRHKRLEQMGNQSNTLYIDQRKVGEEIRYANFIFEKGKFTVINVTSKPIETTANEIIGMISERFKHRDRKLNTPDDQDLTSDNYLTLH